MLLVLLYPYLSGLWPNNQGGSQGPWKVASSMYLTPEQYRNLSSNNTRSIHTVLEFYPSEMSIPSIEYKLLVCANQTNKLYVCFFTQVWYFHTTIPPRVFEKRI